MSPIPSTTPDVAAGLFTRETRPPVPLDHVRVEAHVVDLCARVTVHQAYRNREDVSLEVVYVFPADEGAAVCGFEATVDGIRFVGQAKERDEAFEEYDDALEAGHGGFLLDEERADVFTASLGNMRPGAEVVLSITYVTELAAEGAAARFTLPTTVSPRYAPAQDSTGVGPTPADTLNPLVVLDVPYAFTLEMDLTMSGRIGGVQSPTHPLEVEQDGASAPYGGDSAEARSGDGPFDGAFGESFEGTLDADAAPSTHDRFYSVTQREEPVEPAHAPRDLDRLVALQSADGSWELTPEFAEINGRSLDELEAELRGAPGGRVVARRIAATSLAVEWLEANAGAERAEWEMLAEKARRWLAKW